MVMSPVERIMARRQITAMIEADKVEITIMRRDRIEVAGGGWRWGDFLSLPPQTVGFIPFKRRMTEFLINTEQGNLPDLPYVVLGFHTLDIRRDDQFECNGDTFVVKTVDIKEEVRIAAQVDYLAGGGGPNG